MPARVLYIGRRSNTRRGKYCGLRRNSCGSWSQPLRQLLRPRGCHSRHISALLSAILFQSLFNGQVWKLCDRKRPIAPITIGRREPTAGTLARGSGGSGAAGGTRSVGNGTRNCCGPGQGKPFKSILEIARHRSPWRRQRCGLAPFRKAGFWVDKLARSHSGRSRAQTVDARI